MTYWEKSFLVYFILLTSFYPFVIDIDKSGGIISTIYGLFVMASAYGFIASGEKKK